MEKFFQNTAARTILALMCCALWGSAFPCVKIGYEWFQIVGAGSQILAALLLVSAGIFAVNWKGRNKDNCTLQNG